VKAKIVILILMVYCLIGCSDSDLPDYSNTVPPLQGHINDYANLFNQETRDSLEKRLARYEDSTSTQIAVLTIKSIGDNTIEQYSEKVATAWKLGQKGKDNGVLITIAKDNKKIRIEVGYGLEGALPDGSCWYIIEHCFKSNMGKHPNFDAAINETVDAIILTIKGEFQIVKAGVKHKDHVTGFWITLAIISIIAGFIGLGADNAFIGGAIGVIAYPLAWYVFWGLDPLIMLGLAIAGFIVCALARFLIEIWAEGQGGSSGSSFSGGSSGSGFFGDGGSFGGGGASGGW
jgi:uncharacterized protein